MTPLDGSASPAEERIVAVYRETIDALYGYVSRHCGGDRALAEDVTQETWLRAVREWRKSGPPDRPIAWLTTVARNLLASYFRKHPARLASATPVESLADTAAAPAAESSDVRAAVTDALGRMPPAEAQLLEAYHFDDRRVAHIALTAGVSERAVEGRLRRARQRLRRELEALIGGKR